MLRVVSALLAAVSLGGCDSDTPTETEKDAVYDCGVGYILFQSRGDLYRMFGDGTEVQQLTDDPDIETSPRWSPDGMRIAFLKANALWIMDAGGGNAAIAASLGGLPTRLAWSRGSESIAIVASDGGVALFDVASGDLGILVTGAASTPVAWSRDDEGDLLLYVVADTDAMGDVTSELRVIRRDGMHDSLLFAVEGAVLDIAWSRDGRSIAILRDSDGDTLTEIYDPQGSLELTLDFYGPTNLVWSPQSECLAATVDPARTEIVELQDLTEGSFEGSIADWIGWAAGPMPARPAAAFTAKPEAVAIGELVDFDASGSAGGLPIVEYAWDFQGDGKDDLVGASPLASFAYDAPGSYDVRLIVRDTAGEQGVATRTVTVAPKKTATLTIEFVNGATGSVHVHVDGVEVQTCTATCSIETPLGAKVVLVPKGGLDGWSGCDVDHGAAGCELAMDTDRTVKVQVLPPS